jgi:hypothetical protein
MRHHQCCLQEQFPREEPLSCPSRRASYGGLAGERQRDVRYFVRILLTWMILKHSTGAATLLIHILANMATPIHVSRTVLGLVPALLKVKVAIIFAMLYLLSAAAIVKPPSSNMITGVHIAAKM